MDEKIEKLKDIKEIRTLMERASLFLSLSGIAGIIVGFLAILAVALVYIKLDIDLLDPINYEVYLGGSDAEKKSFYSFIFTDFTVALILSIFVGILFAIRKAKKEQQPIWDATSRRLLINMFIPLIAGGLFCLILVYHGNIHLIAPITLLFYGLALLNASKYTITDIRYLGIIELVVGLAAAFFVGYGLLFWVFGFGVLHIVYGTTIYLKYER